ncbi:hypothetical protein [Halalkalicoccus tibetensis]|uniref:Secreted protein n=1 Tax=Halalkalicoccus tibetensis TaxID=175632 RepID=A0ABD5VAQ4_9EURY
MLVARFHSQYHLCVRSIAVVLPVGGIDRDGDTSVGEVLDVLLLELLEELLIDIIEVLAQFAPRELLDRTEVSIAIRRPPFRVV